MGDQTFCLFFSLAMIGKNIRQICQILLITLSFRKTKLLDNCLRVNIWNITQPHLAHRANTSWMLNSCAKSVSWLVNLYFSYCHRFVNCLIVNQCTKCFLTVSDYVCYCHIANRWVSLHSMDTLTRLCSYFNQDFSCITCTDIQWNMQANPVGAPSL